MEKQKILQIVLDKNKNLSARFSNASKYAEIRDFLKEKFPNLEAIEALYLYVNDLTSPATCKHCASALRFINFTNGYYSDECPRCSFKSAQEKTRATVQAKYGVEHISQTKDFKEKVKQTNLMKFGNESFFKSDYAKENKERWFLDKLGVANPMYLEETKSKIKNTCQDRYGTNSPMQNLEIQNKVKTTCLKRYGVEHTWQDEGIKTKSRTQRKSIKYLHKLQECQNELSFNFSIQDYIDNIEKYKHFSFTCKICNKEFTDHLANGNLPKCESCYPTFNGTSKIERDFTSFIQSLDASFKSSDRTVLNGKEIDCYSPTKNIGFEFNGVWFHSENAGKNPYSHFNKTEQALENGVTLFHIFEDEWINKQEIVKSRIRSILGNNDRKIFARKCTIQHLDVSTTRKFLEEQHLQGYAASSVKLGLYFGDELVSVMTFGPPRFNKKYEWELIRFASLQNTTVVGGASKLFKFFCRLFSPTSILSYADRCWSNGNLYEKIGFKLVNVGKPGYFYYKNKKRINRLQLTKNKMKSFPTFNPILNEFENASSAGYLKIHDCGQLVFVWKK